MKVNSVVVFGAGRFGSALAKELFIEDIEVMVIDNDEEKIQEISPYVTTAIIADVLDEGAIKELGLSNFDVAVVAIGSNLEASIVAAVEAKEYDIPMIYAKAGTDMQSRILKKVGVDQVIYPEIELGERLARSISGKSIIEYIHFSEEYSIVEINAPQNWSGKSLKELDVRNKFNINIIAIRKKNKTVVSPSASEKIEKGDSLIVIGEDQYLRKMEKHA
ncbi:MAG: TrkA family potassium uptake protein [Tissierellia bacterium]|nr:TrkA family potassium uptake protein [Tissierellia bacterium]